MRECGECTLCCRGTISLKVNEHRVFPGQPCPHVTESGCGIYDDLSRPAMCDTYNCVWKKEWYIPDWLRPDKVGFLLTYKGRSKCVMLTADFSANHIDGVALLWVIQWCTANQYTLVYTVNGKERDYMRGNIKNHPQSTAVEGSLQDIFEPIELFNDE
tara:strand:- start:10800 stop:11273 length:474 start_codon:yes stop_codon:yes gene_type:complete